MSSQAVVEPGKNCSDKSEDTRSYDESRFNALKHGMNSRTPVLPGEDPSLFQARIDGLKASLETRNTHENDLVEQAALASWRRDRANRVEVARLTANIVTEPEGAALLERKEARQL